MEKPLVSIVIPTYNRADKINMPIESILDQIHTNWELLIIDDKSSDNIKEVVDAYSKQDKRIQYFLNTGNKGPAAARNYGIKLAKGKYVAFMDSDDRWLNNHLSSSVAVLEKYNKEVSFALWYEVSNGVKKPITELDSYMFEKGFTKFKDKFENNVIVFENTDFYENLFKEDFYIYHVNTMVVKRSILDESLMFDETLRFSDDCDFTFRSIMKYGFCFINEFHYEYYYWDDSLYAFVDRRNFNFTKIRDDVDVINRITRNGIYKIMCYKKRKKAVRQTNFVKNKKTWLAYFNGRISKKYFTMGFLNKNINRFDSLYFYLLSLFYNFSKQTLKFILMESKYIPDLTNRTLNAAIFDIY